MFLLPWMCTQGKLMRGSLLLIDTRLVHNNNNRNSVLGVQEVVQKFGIVLAIAKLL